MCKCECVRHVALRWVINEANKVLCWRLNGLNALILTDVHINMQKYVYGCLYVSESVCARVCI